MKSIKEISEQAKVSKTSIYNLIKKNNISTIKLDGKSYLDEAAEAQILTYYTNEQSQTIQDVITVAKKENEGFNTTVFPAVNQAQLTENMRLIDVLEEQLNEKDKTIHSLIQSQQALLHSMEMDKQYQALLIVDKNKSISSQAAPPKRKKFLSFFFKAK